MLEVIIKGTEYYDGQLKRYVPWHYAALQASGLQGVIGLLGLGLYRL